MQLKSYPMHSMAKFSTICVFAIALTLGNTTIASADRPNPTRNNIVKTYTDLIYYNKLYPEFGNRRLQSPDVAPGDASYWREWRAIYQAVDREVKYGEINCGDGVSQDWRLADYDRQTSAEYTSRSLDRITNVIFKQRRQRLGDQITTREWRTIRKKIELTDRVACFLPIQPNPVSSITNPIKKNRFYDPSPR